MNEPTDQGRLRLFLIRHGEIEEASLGKLVGRTDAPLSVHGLEQAHQLADMLSKARLTAVQSSDLQRTSTTAKIIATGCNLDEEVSCVWREIDMGEWEGRTVASLHIESPRLVEQLFDDPASFKYPGGESFALFTARVQRALDQLLVAHKTGNIALIAHGGVCRMIIGSALGMPPRNWLRLAQEYGCLNVIDWYDQKPLLRLLNYGSFRRGEEPLIM